MLSSPKVFAPHDDVVWIAGELIINGGGSADIQQVEISDEDLPDLRGTKLSISLKRCGIKSLPLQNTNMPANGVDDMTKLDYLHEPSILDNLRRRFKANIPYTYTGEICIAVNPYKWLDLYGQEMREKYGKYTRHELPPHVYATSTDAYRGLTTRAKNQSILVSGESGAGKTETVKILMGHFAQIAGKSNDKTVDKLLKANPLLESFGNAKTAKNDNSSRFGKFSQLEFNDNYVLVGSKCVTYLLEKSRVITQTSLERNYHIMYQLLAASDDVKDDYYLENLHAKDFNYTNGGDLKTTIIEGIPDNKRLTQTLEVLELLGVNSKLSYQLLCAISGILHMGQIRFTEIHGSTDSEATIVLDNGNFDFSTVACCRMIGVDPDLFSKSVISRAIEVEGKTIYVPLNIETATSGRDALAKEIYNRLFQWLVLVINFNTSYSCNTTEEERKKMTAKRGCCSNISLLDIFGFECFTHNGFEQFCINFANEKLQQRFTQDVFKTVQREYQEEGLSLEMITFKDNQETLDMIEGDPPTGRMGIIDIMNEECQIPKGNDSNFLNKIKSKFNGNPLFSWNQLTTNVFTIRHYAGQVTYSVLGFIDTNKDTLPNNFETMLASSENVLLQRLFQEGSCFGSRGTTEYIDNILHEDQMTIESILLLKYGTPGYTHVAVPPIFISGADGRPASPPRRGRLSTDRASVSEFTSPLSPGMPRIGRLSDASMMDMNTPRSSRAMTLNRSGMKYRPTGTFVSSEKILTKFKNQLAALMDVVNSTDVQYVRCIKPNANKSSTEYDRRMVVEQLRSAGMIEAVRISRAAFPNRLLYADFMSRYQAILNRKWYLENIGNLFAKSDSQQAVTKTRSLLKHYFPDTDGSSDKRSNTKAQYALGRTKVYFTSYILENLEKLRNEAILNYLRHIQARWRAYSQRKAFLRAKASATKLQSYTRMYKQLHLFHISRNAIITIQKYQRRLRAKKELQRRKQEKLNEEIANKGVTKLQAKVRRNSQVKAYHTVRRGVILLQSLQRRKKAKADYKKRLSEKRGQDLERVNRAITKFQAKVRMVSQLQFYRRTRVAMILLQKVMRRRRAKAEVERLREERAREKAKMDKVNRGLTKLQAKARMVSQLQFYRRMRIAMILLQKVMRRRRAKAEVERLREERAREKAKMDKAIRGLTKLQAKARMVSQLQFYRRMRIAMILLQKVMRRRRAKAEVERLREEKIRRDKAFRGIILLQSIVRMKIQKRIFNETVAIIRHQEELEAIRKHEEEEKRRSIELQVHLAKYFIDETEKLQDYFIEHTRITPLSSARKSEIVTKISIDKEDQYDGDAVSASSATTAALDDDGEAAGPNTWRESVGGEDITNELEAAVEDNENTDDKEDEEFHETTIVPSQYHVKELAHTYVDSVWHYIKEQQRVIESLQIKLHDKDDDFIQLYTQYEELNEKYHDIDSKNDYLNHEYNKEKSINYELHRKLEEVTNHSIEKYEDLELKYHELHEQNKEWNIKMEELLTESATVVGISEESHKDALMLLAEERKYSEQLETRLWEATDEIAYLKEISVWNDVSPVHVPSVDTIPENNSNSPKKDSIIGSSTVVSQNGDMTSHEDEKPLTDKERDSMDQKSKIISIKSFDDDDDDDDSIYTANELNQTPNTLNRDSFHMSFHNDHLQHLSTPHQHIELIATVGRLQSEMKEKDTQIDALTNEINTLKETNNTLEIQELKVNEERLLMKQNELQMFYYEACETIGQMETILDQLVQARQDDQLEIQNQESYMLEAVQTLNNLKTKEIELNTTIQKQEVTIKEQEITIRGQESTIKEQDEDIQEAVDLIYQIKDQLQYYETTYGVMSPDTRPRMNSDARVEAFVARSRAHSEAIHIAAATAVRSRSNSGASDEQTIPMNMPSNVPFLPKLETPPIESSFSEGSYPKSPKSPASTLFERVEDDIPADTSTVTLALSKSPRNSLRRSMNGLTIDDVIKNSATPLTTSSRKITPVSGASQDLSSLQQTPIIPSLEVNKRLEITTPRSSRAPSTPKSGASSYRQADNFLHNSTSTHNSARIQMNTPEHREFYDLHPPPPPSPPEFAESDEDDEVDESNDFPDIGPVTSLENSNSSRKMKEWNTTTTSTTLNIPPSNRDNDDDKEDDWTALQGSIFSGRSSITNEPSPRKAA